MIYIKGYEIYKYFEGEWLPITIQNIKKNDIIKAKDLDNNVWIPNSEGTETSIVIKDAYEKEDGWYLESKPYNLKEIL